MDYYWKFLYTPKYKKDLEEGKSKELDTSNESLRTALDYVFGDKNKRCAFISPCKYPLRDEHTNFEDEDRVQWLDHNADFRIRIVDSKGEGDDIGFVKDISLGEAMSIASNLEQYTFLYKDKRGIREICSEHFVDDDDSEYFVGDVIKEIPIKVKTIESFLEMLKGKKVRNKMWDVREKIWEDKEKKRGDRRKSFSEMVSLEDIHTFGRERMDMYIVEKVYPRVWNPYRRRVRLVWKERREYV